MLVAYTQIGPYKYISILHLQQYSRRLNLFVYFFFEQAVNLRVPYKARDLVTGGEWLQASQEDASARDSALCSSSVAAKLGLELYI